MENIVGGLAKSERNNQSNDLRVHFTDYLSDDLHFPCNHPDLAEKYKSFCYFMQTSRMVQIFWTQGQSKKDIFKNVAEECSRVPEIYQEACFASMGRDVGGVYRASPKLGIKACHYVSNENMRIRCLGGAVQDYFWDSEGQDEAINFCKILTDGAEKSSCYQIIFDRAKDILKTKDEFNNFCLKAEVNYQINCKEKLGVEIISE